MFDAQPLAHGRVGSPVRGLFHGFLQAVWCGSFSVRLRMGKGDIRTRRGKIVRGTYGNKRRRKRKKTGDTNKR